MREATGGTARWIGLAALAALGLGGGAWWWSGGSEWFLEGGLERFVNDAGAVGPLVFVVSMWLVQPFGLPGTLWMVPAGVVWPWPMAVLLTWVGNMGASTIAFYFARVVGRDWVSPRLPAQVRAFDERRLATGGTGFIVVLRLATGQLAPADWLLGVSKVSTRTFLVGTGLGIVPGIVIAVLGGPAALTWVSRLPVAAQMGVVVCAAALVVVVALRRQKIGGGWLARRRGSRRSRAPAEPSETQ